MAKTYSITFNCWSHLLVLPGSRWLPRQEVTLNVYDLGTEGGTVRTTHNRFETARTHNRFETAIPHNRFETVTTHNRFEFESFRLSLGPNIAFVFIYVVGLLCAL